MPDDNKDVAELEGQVSDLEAQITKLSTALEAATEGKADLRKAAELEADLGEALLKMDELTDALKSVAQERDALADTARLAKLEAGLTEEEREYFKQFPWQKDKEEEEKAGFLEMDPEERKKRAKMAKAQDETVVLDGETISKSAVGAGTFAVLKKQAARIAKTEEDLKQQRAEAEMARLEKRAGDEFGHVPGTSQEKAKMLKAINGIEDEEIRKLVESVFIAHEKLLKNAFNTIGGRPPQAGEESLQKKAQDFESKMEKIRIDEKCTRSEAIIKARKQFPDLFQAYQEDGERLAGNRGN